MLDQAFLIVWNDVLPEVEAEYRRWQRVEHMPERLSVPGFTLGRRYVDPGAAQYRYLTLYEVNGPEVFESETYRARLASPTPWTQRMSAEMTNFVRRVCRTVASDEVAIGGGAATFWLSRGEDIPDTFARALVTAAMGVDGVSAAHVGLVDEAITQVRRDEMQTRAAGTTEDFDAVLIVEGDSRVKLSGLMPTLGRSIEDAVGAPAVASQVYDLALVYRPTWHA